MMIDEVMTETEILAEINRLAQLLAAGKNPAAPAIRTVKVGDLEWQADVPAAPAIRTVKVGNLEWQADVPDEEFTWEEAKAYAASLGDGWRLPTIKELLSLVDYETHNPACSVFPDCPSEWFWSSSPGGSNRAWSVNFDFGYVIHGYRNVEIGARCVRSVGGES